MAELGPDKRILLAFLVSFAVLSLWSLYMQKKYPPRPPQTESPPSPPSATVPAPPERKPVAVSPPPPPTKGPVQQKIGKEEQEIVVETDVARIVFSTRGAVVKSWTLKNFKDAKDEPLDLVHPAVSAALGYPLSFTLGDAAREQAVNQALFVASPEQGELEAPAELTFEYSDGRLAAKKHFRFRDGYVIELETQMLEAGAAIPHGLSWRGGFGDASLETAAADQRIVWREATRIQRKPGQKLGEKETLPGALLYAGLEDRYFAAVFLAATGGADLSVTAQRVSWQAPEPAKPEPVPQLDVAWPAGARVEVFVGPKALDVLEQIQAAGSGPRLDELVDFGWFALIAKPIFLGMRWIHRHWIPNYGWAIVLLTVVINMALFPLKWKSLQSAWKMQKIAPQLRAIQEKYKKYRVNDPRKQPMQEEMMTLYRQHGVNPLGGCLPLLLQIPFFYAFYTVLVVAIELRHASWLWIPDLSVKDQIYVLPVVMTVTMYISTKMTPMTMTDPMQQKMMSLMPVLFGVLFLTVSAGLVLYWMVSNLVGIGQQYWINRYQRARDEAEKLAKRKKKP